jgi:predicted nucleotidyltransferase
VTSDERADEVAALLCRLAGWARRRPDVRALALVGSRARGEARPGSDVDLVLLTDSPPSYTEAEDWLAEMGGARLVKTIERGVLVERRLALPSGLEVDLAVGTPAWASLDPLDGGTRRVVAGGMRALHDPDGLLAALAASRG